MHRSRYKEPPIWVWPTKAETLVLDILSAAGVAMMLFMVWMAVTALIGG